MIAFLARELGCPIKSHEIFAQGIYFSAIMIGALLLASSLALVGDAIVTRADPYMSQADTFRVRQRNYRGLFLGSAGFAVWQASTLLINSGFIQLDVAYLFVLLSVISQFWGLGLVSRQNRDLNTRDFSVYRAGSAQAAR